MNRVVISHRFPKLNDYILIDGKNVDFVYDKINRCFIYIYETNKQYVDITLDNFHPLLLKHWWIMSMIFFFISIFGIFDREKHDTFVRTFEARVMLKEGDQTDIRLTNPAFNNFTSVLLVESNGKVNVTVNERKPSETVIKRKKTLLWCKLLSVFVLVVIAVLLALFIK